MTTIFFYDNNWEMGKVTNPNHTLKLSVCDNDTLSVAISLENPGCLNFASHRRPGGGYLSVIGTKMPIKTQEEDLFRRSNLPEVMDTSFVRDRYPLLDLKSIYCRAMVSKDARLDPVANFEIGVITMAALVNPREDQYPMVKKKLDRIFEIAIINGHYNLVLGAWGCGVFNNDPYKVASYFRESLQKYDGYFNEVIFAIPNKRSENFQVFESVLRIDS